MIRSQPQKPSIVIDNWNEIIGNLWEHLPHFRDEVYVYDDSCLKLDCIKLQYIDQEESGSDSEPWPHQDIPDVEDICEEVDKTKDEKAKDESKVSILQS